MTVPLFRALPTACRTGLSVLLALLFVTSAAAQERMPITTDSDAARQHFLNARDHLSNVEINAAREAVDLALAEDDGFVLAMAMRARLTERGPKQQAYLTKVDAGLASISQGERLLIKAMRAQSDGQAKKAMGSYKALAKMYPDDPDAQFTLGAMYMNMRNPDKALKYLTRATEIDPAFAAAYNLLGYRAMYQGDMEAAETAFTTYVDLRSDKPNPHDSLAEFYMKQGRFSEAVASYRKAFDVDNRYVAAKSRAGVALALSGDVEAARVELKEAMALTTDPGDKAGIYSDLANTYLFEDDVDGAIRVLADGVTWAQTASPDRAAFLTMAQGWIYYENERFSEAAKMRDVVVKDLDAGRYSAENETYIRSRVAMASAFDAIAQGDLTAATAYIDEFEAHATSTGAPDDAEVLHELKAVHAYKAGDVKTAITHMAQAGDQPHVHYHLGRLYLKDGQTEKGRKHLTKAANANEPTRSFALVRNRALKALAM